MPSPELYKDKVEVSLDGRQIFYLFFGGAVIVGMVFVLGVMVGRRVEARGHLDRAHTQAAADPLAALDRLEGSGGLSFHGALTGAAAPSEVDKTIGELEKARLAEAGKPGVAAKPEPSVAKPEPVVAKPEPVVAKPEPVVVAKPKPAKKPHDAEFTLQLSSFQDKAEADAFLASIKSAGYQAYVTSAEVEGKGTFYRIRLGSYRTLDAANDAKADFEKAAKKAAYVTRL